MLHALSDPVRLRIVAGLAREDERTCASFELPVTKSTCTHHFQVLREAGVIHQRPLGAARSTRSGARISTRASPACSTRCCALRVTARSPGARNPAAGLSSA